MDFYRKFVPDSSAVSSYQEYKEAEYYYASLVEQSLTTERNGTKTEGRKSCS